MSAVMPIPFSDKDEEDEDINLKKVQIFVDAMIGLKEILTTDINIKHIEQIKKIDGDKEEKM